VKNLWRFCASTVGQKVLVALTGIILLGFVVAHLAGNLLVYLGSEAINAYAKALGERQWLVWACRLATVAALGIHVWASIRLTMRNRTSRGGAYIRRAFRSTTYAARTMAISGVLFGLYLLYHVPHFTLGSAHPGFVPGDVYRNVVLGFNRPLVSLVYVAAMVFLGLHLRHGLWSMFRTLGLNHPARDGWYERFAVVASAIIVAGYISIPISVMMKIVV